MSVKRPRLYIKMAPADAVPEVISILAVIFLVSLLAFSWQKLPDIIPIHYNSRGQVNGYGGKGSLLLLFSLMLVLYAALTVLARFPHIYNYSVEITEDNAEFQYRSATRLIRLLKLELVLVFGYIETIMIASAGGKNLSLGLWFLPLVIIVMFGTIGFYIYKSVRHK